MAMEKIAVLFLAAGYGTRLQRDIENSSNEAHQKLRGIAKALLPLNGTPLIDYWIQLLQKVTTQHEIFVVCNASNHTQFKSWAEANSFPSDHMLNDGSTDNASRLGAVADMELAVRHFKIADKGFRGLLVIAGDTLFLRDFNLQDFISKSLKVSPACLVTSYTVRDEETVKTGIMEGEEVQVDGSRYTRIRQFLEKPSPDQTTSRSACPCFYFLPTETLGYLSEFLTMVKATQKLEEFDATGKYVQWLVHQAPVYATGISGRLDIGGLASLIEAEMYMKNK
ncbi:hypothetical protein HDU67_007607 [Dinochytrium kinnereticum]|nr:hypothetical protein HDU67_007607 [Dinochytrium kinnereticum]